MDTTYKASDMKTATAGLGAMWSAWFASHSLEASLQIVLLILSIIGSLLYILVMIQRLRKG